MEQSRNIVTEVAALLDAHRVPEAIISSVCNLLQQHDRTAELPRCAAANPVVSSPSHLSDIGELAASLHHHALRKADFLGDLAGDLAWQMLLALTVADASGAGLPISDLCLASGGPIPTALRYIAAMDKRGLVDRVGDPEDCKTSVRLTADARERMHAMLLDYRA